MEYKCNYFIGNDPAKWHTDVPNFKAVVFEDIYAGIDLKYYGNGDGRMEYDFLISPGADVSQIMVQYDGAKSVSVNDSGELVVETGWGEMIERRPIVYQIEPSGIRPIEGEYVLLGNDRFGFQLDESYEPIYATVIDPVLSYSTYLGGGAADVADGIAVDAAGCAHITGVTWSSDFPTQNAYDGSMNGDFDAFVAKVSADGNSLVYSTFLGGSSDAWDEGFGIAVDGSGCAYVAGKTESLDFPTYNAYDDSFNWSLDAFVTKFSSAGNALVYSTYLGGTDDDWGNSIAVDGYGCAYVTGTTSSDDFPTFNPYESTIQGGGFDAFVAKLSSVGSSLAYSTYLGGSGTDHGNAVAVDGSGAAYVTGMTFSTDFPTLNEYQTVQGHEDVFVTKFSSSGTDLVYSTYLAGSDADHGTAIAVDASGAAHVTGYTFSSDFPILNSYQTNQGSWDVFVAKLSSSGSSLAYSTYLGGSGEDKGYGIKVDGSGVAYVTGWNGSTDFPTTNPYQTNQASRDVFVAALSSFGSSLVFSTYLGGGGEDKGNAIALDASGAVYVTGYTVSSDFPTQNAFDATGNGMDAFVTKLTSQPVVSSLADSGPGSLRAAIEAARSAESVDTIRFEVSGTINLVTPLPPFDGNGGAILDQGVALLGATAPGGAHSVILDGSSLSSGDGIVINSNYCGSSRIDGLVIRNFPGNGVTVIPYDPPVWHLIANNLIYGNGGLAIDIGDDGVSPNEWPDDFDILNFPEIDSVRFDGLAFTVFGQTLDTGVVIDFYVAHPIGDGTRPEDPSGHGEAYYYIGSAISAASLLKDREANSFQFEFPDTLAQFTKVTMMATAFYYWPVGTSEFSENFTLTPSPLIITATSQPGGGKRTPPSVVNLWITDPNGDYLGRDAAGNLSQTLFPADYDQEAPIYDDSITIHDPLLGEYIIEIIAENGAGEGDRYSINVRIDGSAEVVLAREMDVPLGASGPDTIRYVVEEGCDYINGDANGSGGEPPIDIDDIVFLITYVFASGPAPEPLMSGDANCSQFIDIDDIVWLISYVFAGAAPPCSD